MVNKKTSDDAKRIGLRLLSRGRDSRQEVAEICGMSTRTLFRAAKRFRETGSVAKAAVLGTGRPRSLRNADARPMPTIFFAETITNLGVQCGIDAVPELKESNADSLQAKRNEVGLSLGSKRKPGIKSDKDTYTLDWIQIIDSIGDHFYKFNPKDPNNPIFKTAKYRVEFCIPWRTYSDFLEQEEQGARRNSFSYQNIRPSFSISSLPWQV
ncbi:hypothetical protein B0H13DRAFT_1856348 [Mycena leptocephala]|nr:hypothetical protein B0H13DRAFT_1856348 [Mycena leptocephala]